MMQLDALSALPAAPGMPQGNHAQVQQAMFQLFSRMFGVPAGASGHVSLGDGATRFSQFAPTMMGNSSSKFRLANPTIASEPAVEVTYSAPRGSSEPGVSLTGVPSSDVWLADDHDDTNRDLDHHEPGDEGNDEDACDDGEEEDDDVESVVDEPVKPAAASPVLAVVPVTSGSSTAVVAVKAPEMSLLAKMEAEMLAAHKSRDTKRGKYKTAVKEAEVTHAAVAPVLALPPAPAASGEPKPKSGVKRRPSSTILKRPAAPNKEVLSHVDGVNMKDVFDKLREEKGPITRGAFTSRAHDVAKNRAKKKIDIEEACKFARYNYQEASKLYDDMKLEAPIKRGKK